MINTIDSSRNREDTNKIGNEKANVITDTKEIQMIRKYYE